MRYEMEELVPIVGKLAEKYTAHESTSITYEKAEQLMEAVLYCIHEAEQAEKYSLTSAEGISAQQAYKAGVHYVEQKVRDALQLYNQIVETFEHYENQCLYDTFIKGLPEFFKWYDIWYKPQDTIVTLDYPVRKNLSGYTGIDKIYEYLVCIGQEQKFLNAFSRGYVIDILLRYNHQYQYMIENIGEVVYKEISKQFWEENISPEIK